MRQYGGNGPEKVRMRGKSSPNLATSEFGKSRKPRRARLFDPANSL
jgi:hypothetical protein